MKKSIVGKIEFWFIFFPHCPIPTIPSCSIPLCFSPLSALPRQTIEKLSSQILLRSVYSRVPTQRQFQRNRILNPS